ncbi:two-component system osmolarity sensor histidine kinase EnvZ [Stenotrophomonas sp. AN71]|uniref:ATP-binding protein n=1 Tax=Stenotrophomonas sp. AN71 TaxID=3156253 RepID=UPI003D228883
MSEVAPPRWRFPRPRSLMWQNLLLLVGLAIVIHACVLAVHLLVLRSNVLGAAETMAHQIRIMNSAFALVEPSRRDEALTVLRGHGLQAIEGEPPPGSDLPPNESPYALMAGRRVQAALAPDIKLHWAFVDPKGGATFWVRLNVAGRDTWLMSRTDKADERGYNPLAVSLLLTLGLSGLATIVALFIQRRINRPLRDVAAATRRISEGGGQAHLPVYETSELATLAAQFNEMVDSLHQAEATRALMLAGISHDIRTPLARLRMTLALEGGETEAMAARCIGQVDAIIGQFLDFGHAGNGESPVECDLNVLVQQTAAEFEAEGHPFELQLQPLPRQIFRPVAMQRVIQNLMDNALKYAGTGLQVRTWLQGDDMHLAVADRGAGLAVGERSRVLQAFVRGGDAKDVGGLGLGLAIVERLLQLHGGRLQLLAREGGGLEARVALPVVDVNTSRLPGLP